MNYMKGIDIKVIAQPAMFVSSTGIITFVNDHLMKLLGFQEKDILHQNINTLITTKLMQPHTHDVLLKNYHLNKDSRIIGRPRLLPFKNSQDEEQFVTLQVISLGKGKDFFFFCLLSDYFCEFRKISIIPEEELRKILRALFAQTDKSELFTTHSPQIHQLCSNLETYLQYELHLLARFMIDNSDVTGSWKYAKYLILDLRWLKLDKIYEILLKFDHSKVAYLNLICVRLLFPVLAAHSASVRKLIGPFAADIYGDQKVQDISHIIASYTEDPPHK